MLIVCDTSEKNKTQCSKIVNTHEKVDGNIFIVGTFNCNSSARSRLRPSLSLNWFDRPKKLKICVYICFCLNIIQKWLYFDVKRKHLFLAVKICFVRWTTYHKILISNFKSNSSEVKGTPRPNYQKVFIWS